MSDIHCNSERTTQQLRSYAACVFEPTDTIELRLLHRVEKPRLRWCQASELPQLAATLLAENIQERHICAGINPRRDQGGSRSADVALARTLVADFDNTDLPAVQARLATTKLPNPTLLVWSGHGVHCYWRFAQPMRDLSAWRISQARLSALLDSDRNIKDAARLMRLPGFDNWKEPVAAAYIVEAHPGRVYGWAELLAMLTSLPEERRCAPLRTKVADVLPAWAQELHLLQATGPDQWKACCPAHNDENPSLSLGVGEDQRILMFCHAGCNIDTICARLGITKRDLFPGDSPDDDDTDPSPQPVGSPLEAHEVDTGGYHVEQGCLCRTETTRQGEASIPLANFSARIVEQIVYDDGQQHQVRLVLEGQLAAGTPLPRVEIAAGDFAAMAWVLNSWGSRAVIRAGPYVKDHLRAGIQFLSGDVPVRRVFTHLGWRLIDDHWHYLHIKGAIGPEHLVREVTVSPPPALSRFTLPAPPGGDALTRACKASLRLLDIGPDRIMVPAFAAPYVAVLTECDFALQLAGKTGVFKSELAALLQQHFGPEMTRLHLPCGWASTANALEGIAFAAKDALLVVDDFAPSGTAYDIQRLHQQAERLLRSQGNHNGRQRLRADLSLRPERYPRGLILLTGEEIPRGSSLQARMLVLEITSGNIHATRLTECQRDAAEGLYAQAMAGFLAWLAARKTEVDEERRQAIPRLRARFQATGQHARTPGIVAELFFAFSIFLRFAQEEAALDAADAAAVLERAERSFVLVLEQQVQQQNSVTPPHRFLELLIALLASGKAHLCQTDGSIPRAARLRGWRTDDRDGLAASGTKIGWAEGDDIFLNRDVAFGEAQKLANAQGQPLTIEANRLWRWMKDDGQLASYDDGKTTIKRTVEGRRLRVLHLSSSALER